MSANLPIRHNICHRVVVVVVVTVVAWQRLSSDILPPCLRRSCIWLSAFCCLPKLILAQMLSRLCVRDGFYQRDGALTPRIRDSAPLMQRGGAEDNVETVTLGLVPHHLHHPEFADRFLWKGDSNGHKRLWKHDSYQSFEIFRYKSPTIDLSDVYDPRSYQPRS